ncbi:MAG: DUF6504 family protein [Desulfobacterales bacterium]
MQFISEMISPVADTIDMSRAAPGAPGLPAVFTWRDRRLVIVAVLRQWRETGPCRHGSGERYVRRHWYEVQTESGAWLKIYFERQTRPGSSRFQRWWLHSMTPAGEPAVPPLQTRNPDPL